MGTRFEGGVRKVVLELGYKASELRVHTGGPQDLLRI